MKNIYALTLVLSLSCVSISAQRILEIVSDPMNSPFDQTESAGYLYVAENNSATLRRFDGTTLANFTYPMRIGRQLIYKGFTSDKMVDYRSALFLILHEDGGSFKHV